MSVSARRIQMDVHLAAASAERTSYGTDRRRSAASPEGRITAALFNWLCSEAGARPAVALLSPNDSDDRRRAAAGEMPTSPGRRCESAAVSTPWWQSRTGQADTAATQLITEYIHVTRNIITNSRSDLNTAYIYEGSM